MRSLILKEARELALPFLLALVLSCTLLLRNADFEELLLGPSVRTDSLVLWWGGLCGLLIGYRQFASELRRGTHQFLLHRGTGRRGAFVAKVAIGSLAASCLAALPPALDWLWYTVATPYAPIVQSARLGTLLLCASFALPAYGAGVFAVAMGRARGWRLLFAFAASYGAVVTALWGATELAGAGLTWSGPVLSVALATAALLALAWQLLLREIDPEFALPVRSSVAMAIASLALAVVPAGFAIKVLQSFTARIGGPLPILAQDRATHEFFAVLQAADGSWRRVDGKPIVAEYQTSRGMDLWDDLRLFYPLAIGAGSAPPSPTPPQVLEALHHQVGELTVRYYNSQWSWIQLFQSFGGSYEDPRTELVLDPDRGSVRCFRFPTERDPSDSSPSAGPVWDAKEYEVAKPGGGPVWILGEEERSARLFDPADATLWRFARAAGEVRLEPAEWPGGDRLQRVEDLYSADYAVIGESARRDKLYVCERGRYVWRSNRFVDYDSSDRSADDPYVSGLILAAEVPSRATARVEQVDTDPLAPSWVLRDARTEEILCSWRVEPLATRAPWSWLATKALWLLRPPAAAAWNFFQPPRSEVVYPRSFWQTFLAGGADGSALFAGGRRAGLATACAGLGMALGVWVLRRRNTPLAARCAWAAMVALCGVPVFVLFRFCESRAERAALERAPARRPLVVAEPLIQSA